jgi:dihydrofolate synthase / folylpolyglutamate synthase
LGKEEGGRRKWEGGRRKEEVGRMFRALKCTAWSRPRGYNDGVTYDEAVEYLLSFADFERSGRFQDRPDVAPMRRLLEALPIDGDPDWWFVLVHIAGSKGKGSVAAMIEAILCEAGSKTGLYSSPHLHSYTERVRRCGEPLSEERFSELVERYVRPAAERVTSGLEGRAFVTFDLLTALGIAEFATAGVDYLVLETGLGGRVDSTNVFSQTDVVVLTPISLEHTAVLGETVEAIAREKAGIMKPHANVVMAPQPYAEAAKVFREAVDALAPPLKGPRLVDVGSEYEREVLSHDRRGQNVRISGLWGHVEARLPLIGRHQAENAATAIAAVKTLDERIPSTIDAHPETIARGLAKTKWPGRMEVVHEGPLVVVDGAHNTDSARRFVEAMREYLDAERAVVVVGSSGDKDIDGLARELAPVASRVFAAKAKHPRAMEPARITVAFRQLGIEAEDVDTVGHAIERAMAGSEPSGLICVVGSLFVAAEGREYFGLRT